MLNFSNENAIFERASSQSFAVKRRQMGWLSLSLNFKYQSRDVALLMVLSTAFAVNFIDSSVESAYS